MRIQATTLALAVACAVALPGCGGSGTASEVLEAQVVPVEAVKVLSETPVNPVEGAMVIKFTVSGPGMSDVSTTYDFTAGGGALPAFAEGYERQLTVEVCRNTCDETVGDDIISRGRSVPLTLFQGDTRSATVFLATRNSMVAPMKAAEGGPETSVMNNKNRVGATVTTLDDGRVLIAGGAKIKAGSSTWYKAEDLESLTADAEIFDPRTGEFTAVSPMNQTRAHHVAVKLGGPNRADGRVLILGGFSSSGGAPEISKAVEIFDPDTNSFVMEPEDRWLAGAGRALFTAALAYPDQNVVFLAGGIASPAVAGGSWQLYMADTGTIDAGALTPGPTGDPGAVGAARWNHTMTYLPAYGKDSDGNSVPAFVLMGGENDVSTLDIVEAYLVDPLKAGKFSVRRDTAAVTSLPLAGRAHHSAVYVARQDIVYVAGGFQQKNAAGPLDRIEVYRVGSRGFNPDEYLVMAAPRGGATSTLLDHNTIFIAGGKGDGGVTSRTEVIVETVECKDNDGSQQCYRVPRLFSGRTPDLDAARAGQSAVFDATRRLFLVGGVSDANATPDPILYNPE